HRVSDSLSLHDALPISYFAFKQVLMKVLRFSPERLCLVASALQSFMRCCDEVSGLPLAAVSPFRQELMKALRSSPFLPLASALRSEEHTSELQSREKLV